MKQTKWMVLLLGMLVSMFLLSNLACSNDDDDDTVANDDDTVANDDDTVANDDDTGANDDDTGANDDDTGANDDDTESPPDGPHVTVPCDGIDAVTLELPMTVAVMEPLGGTFELPVGLGAILQGLVGPDSIPPLLFGFMSQNGDQLEVLGALALEGLPVEQDLEEPTLGIPEPADFSCNPYYDISMDLFELEIDSILLQVEQMQLTGKLTAAGGMENGTLGGVIDPAPLVAELGLDPCTLLATTCNADGNIELLITGLVGDPVDIVLQQVTE